MIDNRKGMISLIEAEVVRHLKDRNKSKIRQEAVAK